jgi:Ca-activated chloride channel family protein
MVQFVRGGGSMFKGVAASIMDRCLSFLFVGNKEGISEHGSRKQTIKVALRQENGAIAVRIILLAAFLLVRTGWADVGSSMRRGNRLERKGEYEEALKSYQEALVQEPDDPQIHYNIGRVLYRMQRYDEAISEFQLGLLKKNKGFQADVFFNVGNSQFKKRQLDPAIESYRMSLLADHDDIEAKQNLEFCLKIKEQMQNQPQNDSTQNQQKQQQQQEQQQQPQVQPKEGDISKKDADRVLQALQSKEKENLEKSRTPEKKEDVDKDW